MRGLHSKDTGGTATQRNLTTGIIIAIIACAVIVGCVIAAISLHYRQSSTGAVLSTAGNSSMSASASDSSEDVSSTLGAAATTATSTSATTRPSSISLDVPYISQFPDLPTGCEITAATMALDYYGFTATNVELDSYLAKSDYYFGFDYESGIEYGPDPDEVFIGDTATEDGSFCNPGPIAAAIDDYIADNGGGYHATVITGYTPEQLYDLVGHGTPVVIWVTTYMQEYDPYWSWYSQDGNLVQSAQDDHAMVLVGYDDAEGIIYVNDPIDDSSTEYSMEDFENVFIERGKMALIIEANTTTSTSTAKSVL